MRKYTSNLKYRFFGEQVSEGPGKGAVRNNGIMIHGQDAETMDKNRGTSVIGAINSEDGGFQTFGCLK